VLIAFIIIIHHHSSSFIIIHHLIACRALLYRIQHGLGCVSIST
jgi:hypothetical protein